MKYIKNIIGFATGAVLAGSASTGEVNWDQLENFPVTMTFKALKGFGMDAPVYKPMLEAHKDMNWIHAPDTFWGNRMLNPKIVNIRDTFPDKIITLQDAWGGSMFQDGYRIKNVWAGHWLYKPGTIVENDLAAGTTQIRVRRPKRIIGNPDLLNRLSEQMAYTVVLYRLKEDGTPDFDHAEQAVVTEINGDMLTVKRGEWHTEALEFEGGKTVAAPHMYFWGKQWQMNLSLHCPRGGPKNLTAAEWWADEVIRGVELTRTDGIEFDVARWTYGSPGREAMDCNNDRVADHGWIDGINSFGLGGQVALQRIRDGLPGKIVQMDSNNARHGQRGWKYVNGIQIECFPSMNDFSRFSEEFLHLRLWSENAQEQPRLSYPFTKTATTTYAGFRGPNGEDMDWRFRTGLAAACLTGMPHPFLNLLVEGFQADEDNSVFANSEGALLPSSGEIERAGVYRWDEYFGGDLNRAGWLGRPEGVAKQIFDAVDYSNNLVNLDDAEWVVRKRFTAEQKRQGTAFATDVNSLPSGELPYNLYFGVQLNVPLSGEGVVSGEEYTLEFEARGDDAWTVNGAVYDDVPRAVMIKGPMETTLKHPWSVLVDHQWRKYRLSFIAGEKPAANIQFGCSEQVGKTFIRNVGLYRGGAERWVRRFEHGLVVLNMTTEEWNLDIPEKLYRRLKGEQNPEINNGAVISSQLTVPPNDAVFLLETSN